MMRKSHITVTTISVLIALLAGFTGCNNETSSVPDNSISTPESTVESTDNSEISEGVPKQRLTDEQTEMIAGLKKQSFVGPDGETVQAVDAIDVYKSDSRGHVYDDDDVYDENGKIVCDENGIPIYKDGEWIDTLLKYDFAYIDYVKPFCHYSPNNEEADYSKLEEWTDKLHELCAERNWVKIKAGDKLENGLIVVKAECEVLPINQVMFSNVNLQFDGNITVEGILTYQEKDDYLSCEGDAIFIPDGSATNEFPLVFTDWSSTNSYTTVNGYAKGGYLVCDGQSITLGQFDDLNIDKNEIFSDDLNHARVKITFKDPSFYTIKILGAVTTNFIDYGGKIVDVERID